MISRIYIVPHKGQKIDCYTIDSTLSRVELNKIGEALTNMHLEAFYINEVPNKGFAYAVEIGFLPGVTDNVAHTVKETIIDLFSKKLNQKLNLEIYSSKIFLYKKEAKCVAELYNPLIERATILNIKNKSKIKFPMVAPKVVLKKEEPTLKVPLNVSDEELVKIGKEGIQGIDGKRRGALALDLVSMKAIQAHFAKLKRDPTDIEIEAIAQTWSEHCKHTIFANPIDDIKDGLYKTYIKGATNEIRKQKGAKDFCVSVFSDNAGGIIFDEKYLITHKVETHNSPSALDPFGGAITGIGGVNRDAIGFGLGAKPVANTYGFCFGEPEDKEPIYLDKAKKQKMFPPRRIMEGVIKGINSGGNCAGIPTISGFVRYDDRYKGKPLVFAGTMGLIPRKIGKRFAHEKRAEAGDYIVIVGGRTGLDGVHGAAFSSLKIDVTSQATAVQIGDPITQKKLSDAIVKEARDMGLYNSITDDGAGGFSSSIGEMARESGGAKVFLEKAPLKYPQIEPWEIWISESQERMTLSVPKKNWKVFKELMESRGVEATVIGEFTNSGKCEVLYKGKKIMDLELEFLHNGLPKRQLQTTKSIREYKEPVLPKASNHTKILEELLAVNNVSGYTFISDQYDHEVQAGSVLKPLSGRGLINTDAQVFSPVLSSPKGVVSTTSVYPSYGDISTYDMTSGAIDTAIRNAVCVGGKLNHLALLDNFCWCSSDEPERLGQLVDSVRACFDTAVAFGTPFISGKDSMFNDFKGYDEKGNPIKISVPPTLLISAIGVMPDIDKTVSPEFKNVGDVIYLLGETYDELGASEYYKLISDGKASPVAGLWPRAIGNNVPKVNVQKNLKTYQALENAIEKELVTSAISVHSGGLGVALAKASVGGMMGVNAELKGELSVDAKLFSESQGRIVVSVSPKNASAFEKIMKDISCTKIGKVTKDKIFEIKDGKTKVVSTTVEKLKKSYHSFSDKMRKELK